MTWKKSASKVKALDRLTVCQDHQRPWTYAAVHMMATMDVDLSLEEQTISLLQQLPPSNTQTTAAQKSNSTVKPWNTNEKSQGDDEQSEIEKNYEVGKPKRMNNQTDHEESGMEKRYEV